MVVFGGVETAFADTIYSFTTIDVPSATMTNAFGINNSGQIVGVSSSRGFLYTGSFTTIDVPGANSTNAYGINSSGQIAGFYDSSTGTHGFLVTPTVVPEPPSFTPLATCLVALFAMACCRKRASAGNRPPA